MILTQLIGRSYRYRVGRVERGALVMEERVGTLEHIAVTSQGELAWCRLQPAGDVVHPDEVLAPAEGEDG